MSLKSNMDRFIGSNLYFGFNLLFGLKSNMDRFIDRLSVLYPSDDTTFKIQYG